MGKLITFLVSIVIVLGVVLFFNYNGEKVESHETEEKDEIFGVHKNAVVLDTAIERKTDKYSEDKFYVQLDTEEDGVIELQTRSEDVLKIFKEGRKFDITFTKMGYIKEIKIIEER